MPVPAFMEGLAGLSPLAFSEGVRKLQDRNQGRGGGRGREGEEGGERTKNARCRILRKPQMWGEAGISRGVVRLD